MPRPIFGPYRNRNRDVGGEEAATIFRQTIESVSSTSPPLAGHGAREALIIDRSRQVDRAIRSSMPSRRTTAGQASRRRHRRHHITGIGRAVVPRWLHHGDGEVQHADVVSIARSRGEAHPFRVCESMRHTPGTWNVSTARDGRLGVTGCSSAVHRRNGPTTSRTVTRRRRRVALRQLSKLPDSSQRSSILRTTIRAIRSARSARSGRSNRRVLEVKSVDEHVALMESLASARTRKSLGCRGAGRRSHRIASGGHRARGLVRRRRKTLTFSVSLDSLVDLREARERELMASSPARCTTADDELEERSGMVACCN